MKKRNILFILACGLGLSSCMDLDLSPLSQATNENWFANETQFEMSVNDLLRENLWNTIDEKWADDVCRRTEASKYQLGSIDGQTWEVTDLWGNCYRAIGRDNTIIDKLNTVGDQVLTPAKKDQFIGECLFVRACMYSKLITLFGDVPYSDTTIDIETALSMGRTPKTEVLQKIYADFDVAIQNLPVSSGTVQRPTKGAAYGMKGRIALYNEDWDVAIECMKAVMDLGVYELYPSYRELFLQNTHNTTESVFSIARSISQEVYENLKDYMPRNNGGWAANGPTWDLLAAYLCTDGLPIDESPLFDPHDPFKNRDPRCTETIVSFGENWLGYEYDPRPDTGDEVMNYNTGEEVKNNDNKNNAEAASYNGLLQKKGIDETVNSDNGYNVEPDLIILRYADVLLLYAEALNETGNTPEAVNVVNNQVRARAWNWNLPVEMAWNPGMGADEFRTKILDERMRELMGEMWRRYDLLRTGKYVEYTTLRNPWAAESGNMTEAHKRFPIPYTEITQNEFITEADQNPGLK